MAQVHSATLGNNGVQAVLEVFGGNGWKSLALQPRFQFLDGNLSDRFPGSELSQQAIGGRIARRGLGLRADDAVNQHPFRAATLFRWTNNPSERCDHASVQAPENIGARV